MTLPIAVLNDQLAFAPQISPEQLEQLHQAGYEQLICNRPDNEDPFQPNIANLQAEAEKWGMAVVSAPVADSLFTSETIAATQKALDSKQKTLMFCRSGTRSSILWAIIQTRAGTPLEQTLAQLASIGYDIAHLEDFILGTANMH